MNHINRLSRKRRGTTLLEMMVSCILVSAAVATAIPILSAMKIQRRGTSERQAALIEAENILERLAARNWDELTQQSVTQLELSDWVKSRLPQPQLVTTIRPVPDGPPAKEIRVHIEWQSFQNQSVDVDLSAWVYSRTGASS